MSAYHYIALSKDNKELSGIIEAPDEQGARAKLNELSLSIISLTTVTAPATHEGKALFEFEALDKNGKKVVGTVVADNELAAYIRLFEEYELNVLFLSASTLSPAEKEKKRNAGVGELSKTYDKMRKKKKIKTASEMVDQKEDEERTLLLQKIDFTMHEVETFLEKYGVDLKIEERDAIKTYINQLIRIKDSTNLEHIRATCEKMLEHIQKQELFLHEEQKLRESTQMKAETQALLSELKRSGLQKELTVQGFIEQLQKNKWLSPLTRFLFSFYHPHSDAYQKIEQEIKVAKRHIQAYYKLLVFGKTNAIRGEAWAGIKTVSAEKKRLRLKLRAIASEEAAQRVLQKPPKLPAESLKKLAGWILAFFLIAYSVTYPLTIKQLPLPSLPHSLFFYQSYVTKFVTLFLLILYLALAIRNFWLKKSIAGLLLYPIALFGYLLIAINLM